MYNQSIRKDRLFLSRYAKTADDSRLANVKFFHIISHESRLPLQRSRTDVRPHVRQSAPKYKENKISTTLLRPEKAGKHLVVDMAVSVTTPSILTSLSPLD